MAAPVYNPTIPCVFPIPGGMGPGRMVRVQGSLPPGAQRFAINLQCGPNTDPRDDIALHLNFRFVEMCVVRNHMTAMNWGVEDTDGGMPLSRGDNFEALILCEPHSLKVALNGAHFCEFPHRIPFQRITHLTIDGDTMINMIGFEGTAAGPQQGYMAPPPAYGAPPPAYGAPQGYGPPRAPPAGAHNYPPMVAAGGGGGYGRGGYQGGGGGGGGHQAGRGGYQGGGLYQTGGFPPGYQGAPQGGGVPYQGGGGPYQGGGGPYQGGGGPYQGGGGPYQGGGPPGRGGPGPAGRGGRGGGGLATGVGMGAAGLAAGGLAGYAMAGGFNSPGGGGGGGSPSAAPSDGTAQVSPPTTDGVAPEDVQPEPDGEQIVQTEPEYEEEYGGDDGGYYDDYGGDDDYGDYGGDFD